MRPSFLPRLVNDPIGDPGVFIPFLHQKRAIIFDLGDLQSLSARDILKISHVFVTHTHMDHFIGFDRLLRLFLGRDQDLYLYGPEGFLKNVEGKLAGYSWNLVQNYSNHLTLHVTEVHADCLKTRDYICRKAFLSDEPASEHAFDDPLYEEPTLSVFTRVLDHGLACLGFAVKERFHINIRKADVDRLGLEIGPWIKKFKEALFNRQNPDSEFEVPSGKNQARKRFVLKDLAQQIAIITPGQKISYIADVAYSKSNVERIVELVKDSDHLFIEASFLDKDKEIAENKGHLTARQAGLIAGMAQVQRVTPFHFSPRYQGQELLLEKEVLDAYGDVLKQ